MSWADILKKNNNEFQKDLIKKESNTIDQKSNVFNITLKDYHEEFDIKYSNKIYDLKMEFTEYIEKNGLPFMNNNILNKLNIINHSLYDFNFYDFIKYNSKNIDKVKQTIEKENNDYIKEIEMDSDLELDDDKIIDYGYDK
jgi:hypothetical protein